MQVAVTLNLPAFMSVAQAKELIDDIIAVAAGAIPVHAQGDRVAVVDIKIVGEFSDHT